MLQNQRMIKTLYLNELGLSSEQYSREKRIIKSIIKIIEILNIQKEELKKEWKLME